MWSVKTHHRTFSSHGRSSVTWNDSYSYVQKSSSYQWQSLWYGEFCRYLDEESTETVKREENDERQLVYVLSKWKRESRLCRTALLLTKEFCGNPWYCLFRMDVPEDPSWGWAWGKRKGIKFSRESIECFLLCVDPIGSLHHWTMKSSICFQCVTDEGVVCSTCE